MTPTLRRRVVALLALVAVLAVTVLVSTPQAHAAGGIQPRYVRCSTTYTDTAGRNGWTPDVDDLVQVYSWIQVKHDNADGSVCAVRVKSQWFAGSSGYNGALHEYIGTCFTSNYGASCNGGTYGVVVDSTSIGSNGSVTLYDNWTSTTCPTYQVTPRLYNQDSSTFIGYPNTCSAV